MSDERAAQGDMADAVLRVPDHVVLRAFEAETVVLNLETGQYHGLNTTAGRMLELLRDTGSFTATVEAMRLEFEGAGPTVENDLVRLCQDLAERGMLEIEPPVDG